VRVEKSTVCLSGGFSSSLSTAPSIEYTLGSTTTLFVQLDKNATWFLKGVGGPSTQKGDLKAVEVLEVIREKFHVAFGDPTETAAAVAEGGLAAVADVEHESQPQGDEDDPMNALDDVVEPVPKAGTKPPAKVPRNKQTARAEVQDVVMRKRPPCAGGEQGETTVISVYRKPGSALRNKAQLYLRVDSLDWLLSYAADELHFQGVARTELEQPPSKGNCPAVADLHLEWNFSDKAWDASFLAGPVAGVRQRFSLAELSRDRWTKLKLMSLVNGDLKLANKLSQKQAAKEIMMLWGQAVLRNEGEVFQQEWGLQGVDPLTPAKKRHRQAARGAAVAGASLV